MAPIPSILSAGPQAASGTPGSLTSRQSQQTAFQGHRPRSSPGYSDVLIGLQYGDEGKARVIDLIAPNYDIVARYNGSSNAGHTIETDSHRIVLHQVPSGVFHGGTLLYIGSGCVINAPSLVSELEGLEKINVDLIGRLHVSSQATLIQPHHILMDKAMGASIGTTKNGVGPAYADKALRMDGEQLLNVRVGDLAANFEETTRIVRENLSRAIRLYGLPGADVETLMADLTNAANKILPYIESDTQFMLRQVESGSRVLFEGAQSAMLDVTKGTVPYVTSSNTVAGFAYVGGDLPVSYHRKTIGVAKAVMSRVGHGTFISEFGGKSSEAYCMEGGGYIHNKEAEAKLDPSELLASGDPLKVGMALRILGNEYGASTGRPRRIGMLDLIQLEYAIKTNGVNELFLTKADALSEFSRANMPGIPLVTGYKLGNEDINFVPASAADCDAVTPSISYLPTFSGKLSGTDSFSSLPNSLLKIINAIESSAKCTIFGVGIGPKRDEYILREKSSGQAAMTVAEQIQRFFHSLGVRNVFGILGREASAISFEEFAGINLILTRHEMSAGVMASAVSRFSNSPQVCFATIGPGVTNLATPIATAALDRYPLIAIGTQLETFEVDFNNAHQCVDGVSIAKPLAKFSYEIRFPDEVISTLKRAVAISMTHPFGPSFISIPVDVLQSPAVLPKNSAGQQEGPGDFYGTTHSGHIRNLIGTVNMLKNSSSPLIVVGDAALRTGEARLILNLAERLNIPVVTSYSAKGAIPPDHPLNYGAITPYMDSILGFPALEQIFGKTDSLLLVGYDMVEHLYPKLWDVGTPKTIARLSPFPNNTPKVLSPDFDAVCPLSEGLGYLMQHADEIGAKNPHDISGLRAVFESMSTDRKNHAGGLLPHQVLGILNDFFPDYILANDVGLHRHASALFYRANKPLDFVTSAGLSSFGTGIPLGMGSKLANPSREVVVICGDAGLLSNPGELETAARLGLKMTIVVYNNNKSGLIQRYSIMGGKGTNPNATAMGQADFAKLARSLGCNGIKARSIHEFEKALKSAKTHTGPTLIEVKVQYPELYINEFTKNYHINKKDP